MPAPNLMGVQFQRGDPQDVVQLPVERLATIKFLGNAVNKDLAKFVKDRAPFCFKVWRYAKPEDSNYYQDPVIWASRIAALFDQFKDYIDGVEILNEPVIRNPEEAKKLNEFMVLSANKLRELGYTNIIGHCFSVGNPPEISLYDYLHDGIKAVDFLGLHQYSAPRIESAAEWTSLRHRKVWEVLPDDVKRPILITECGIDLWTNGYMAGGGGYRRITHISDYVGQIKWWLSELAQDSYVKGVHLYGYGLETPWVDMGFDVAQDETDRAEFIRFIQGLPVITSKIESGIVVVPPPPPPVEPPKEIFNVTELGLLASSHVPALAKKASAMKLGAPITDEYDVLYLGKQYKAQAFENGIVLTEIGKWAMEDMLLFTLDGQVLNAPPVITPPPPPPGDLGTPQSLVAIGANVVRDTHAEFYVVDAVVRSGISAFMVVTILDNKGAPKIGTKVANLFPDGNGEVVETDGNGNARFQFGASSAFTNPGSGPFTVFVVDDGAYKDFDASPKRIVYSQIRSDTVRSLGDFRGEHREIYLQFKGR